MQLARKLTLPLALFAFFALGSSAWLSVREAATLHHSDIEHDQGIAARLFIAALAREQARGTAEDGARLLLNAGNRDPDRSVMRLVPLEELNLNDGQRDALARGEPVFELDIWHSAATWLGTTLPDGRPGVLAVQESLAAENEFLRSTVTRQLLSAGSLAALWALVALGLGAAVIGRPMAALADKARRVSRGDYTGPLSIHQRDEIGQLAAEMNAMSDALSAASERLQQEVAARERAQEVLRHADRLTTVGLLAAGIAHELGTPLNVVSMRARMIASGEVEGSDARAGADIIHQQSGQMTRIIRQLLDFARRSTPSLTDVDLGVLAHQAVSLLTPLAEKARCQLEVDAAAPVLVKADASQLQQVFTNLIVNAVHAMPDGGPVRVHVSRARATPPPDVGGPEATFARVEVRDRGQGISPEHLSRVFEPFFTTKPVGDGTGLGLPVAWGILKDHRGWISVESKVGVGSAFTFFLPLEQTS